MPRPALEVADIFRDYGLAWRRANAGHVSLDQLKVMSAIACCRTAALGGHVARCEDCTHTVIAYNTARPGGNVTGFTQDPGPIRCWPVLSQSPTIGMSPACPK